MLARSHWLKNWKGGFNSVGLVDGTGCRPRESVQVTGLRDAGAVRRMMAAMHINDKGGHLGRALGAGLGTLGTPSPLISLVPRTLGLSDFHIHRGVACLTASFLSLLSTETSKVSSEYKLLPAAAVCNGHGFLLIIQETALSSDYLNKFTSSPG